MNARNAILATLATFAFSVSIQWWMGRSWFGPDGQFGLWESNIWGAECSQRVTDAYTFSHIGHGIIFYSFLWLIARNSPIGTRFLTAVFIEVGWELLENSPIIINRYREATIALGYGGDSILNSTSDIGMMILGFLLAWRIPPWVSFGIFLAMEVGCTLWIRDNLILNVIMLIYPIETIKAWQMGAIS